jgi:hypothetical protein
MGKDRWNVAVLTNIGSDGSAQPVISSPRHVFLKVERKVDVVEGRVELAVPAKKTCDCDIHPAKHPFGDYLPTLVNTNALDNAEVTWRVEIEGVRKGIFKKNKRSGQC